VPDAGFKTLRPRTPQDQNHAIANRAKQYIPPSDFIMGIEDDTIVPVTGISR